MNLKTFYQSGRWLRMAKYIRLKYKGTCQKCNRSGTHVHHIEPINVQNCLLEQNLILLCHECHNEIHNPSNVVREDVRFDENGMLIAKYPPISSIEE